MAEKFFDKARKILGLKDVNQLSGVEYKPFREELSEFGGRQINSGDLREITVRDENGHLVKKIVPRNNGRIKG